MLAFIHIPKAAGTTLANILRRNFGRRHFDTRFFSDRPVFTAADYRRIRLLYPKLESIAGHGVTGTSDLATAVPNIRYFTFVREPISRLLSQYQFNWNCLPESERQRWTPSRYFDEVILQDFANVQSRMLAGDHGADAAIEFLINNNVFVGLTESYNESLVLFRSWSKLDKLDIRYQSVNETNSNLIRAEMKQELSVNPQLLERVRKANEHDLRVYQFARQQYEEQKRSYGDSLLCDAEEFANSQKNSVNIPSDQLNAKLYRNLVYKPLRRWIFPQAA